MNERTPRHWFDARFTYWCVILTLNLCIWSWILRSLWAERSCADPSAWAQKSYGRAVAECEARGDSCKLSASAWKKSLTCECTQTIEVK